MKKLSKRLLAMLLVAVMVVAVIPFGAFADDEFKHLLAGGGEEFHSEGNADWVWNGAAGDATGHVVYCAKCYENFTGNGSLYKTKVVNHDFDSATHACKICGYAHADADHTYVIKTGSGNADGHTFVCSGCGFEVPTSHRKLDGTDETFTVIPETDSTCTTQGRVAGKRYDDCGYEILGGLKPLADHTWVNGICSVCGATNTEKRTYYINVKMSGTGSTMLASGATLSLTETEARAYNDASYATAISLLGSIRSTNAEYEKFYTGLTSSDYNTTQFVSAATDSQNGVINILVTKDLTQESANRTSITVPVYVNDETTPRDTMNLRIGDYYFDISFRNYGGKVEKIRVKNGNNTRVINYGDTDFNAKVQDGDSQITLLWDASEMTIYFLRDSSNFEDVVSTKKVYFGYKLGTLPQLDGKDITWYVKGQPINENTIYDWTGGTYVYATPRATADVMLIIYANGVTKTPYIANPIDVTSKVQPSGLLKASALTSTIESAVGKKNLSITGLFDEAGWDYYVDNNKSTKYAQTILDVNSTTNRTGTQFVYVMVNNASSSTADSSNPKTGDTAMIGTAAVVMALAVVGMGTAFYMKKREMI